MDYQKFYNEIVNWINECNAVAQGYGLESEDFWSWVMSSVAKISEKYKGNELVKRQMIMLVEWLQDIYSGVK